MGDRSKAAPTVTMDDLLKTNTDSGSSDSVVEGEKRKSDASFKASVKNSIITPLKSFSKKRARKRWGFWWSTYQPKQNHNQLDGRK